MFIKKIVIAEHGITLLIFAHEEEQRRYKAAEAQEAAARAQAVHDTAGEKDVEAP